MARSSSSTKKAAKLAQKGKGQKIRFQGGIVFPVAVAATLILGLALIVYARQSMPAADSSPPTINDHWHAAYGFYICDTWYQFEGNLEETDSRGQFVNTNFLRTGIHSHDDGVIHWHPYSAAAVGRRATFGVFLETYEVELTNDSLRFPPAQGHIGFTDEYVEGETQCNGEDAELAVKAWGSFSDNDSDGRRFIANMDEIHLDNDGMVFAVYFTADGADQSMPPWAKDLPQLGAVDTLQVRPEDLLQSATTLGADDDPRDSIPTDDTSPPDTTDGG